GSLVGQLRLEIKATGCWRWTVDGHGAHENPAGSSNGVAQSPLLLDQRDMGDRKRRDGRRQGTDRISGCRRSLAWLVLVALICLPPSIRGCHFDLRPGSQPIAVQIRSQTFDGLVIRFTDTLDP